MKVKLKTINFVLRHFGYVLVVATDDNNGSTTLWIERSSNFDKRAKRVRTT